MKNLYEHFTHSHNNIWTFNLRLDNNTVYQYAKRLRNIYNVEEIYVSKEFFMIYNNLLIDKNEDVFESRNIILRIDYTLKPNEFFFNFI